jgi:hypothetical protein
MLHLVEKAIEITVLSLYGGIALMVCFVGYYDVEAKRSWKK